jgi:hypothetical protein
MRIILLTATLAVSAAAQGLTDAPAILQLVRKPGTIGGSIKPYANAGAEVQVVGMRAVTGLAETWMVEAHDSFASVEDLDRKLAAVPPSRPSGESSDPSYDDVLAPTRNMLALYRPEWSFRPDEAVRNFARARYFTITIYRVPPGGSANFQQLIRAHQANSEAVNRDRPDLAYRVISGAPMGTMVFLSPILSLRKFDEGVAPVPPYAQGQFLDTEIPTEHLLFRVDPRISRVSDDFAAADHDFWRK